MLRRIRSWQIIAIVFFSCRSLVADDPFRLAANGQANARIVHAKDCSPATKKTAGALKLLLKRISDAEFEITTGDGRQGIVLGTTAEFPDLAGELPKTPQADEREQYLIRSQSTGLWLIATTDIGLEHAVWDLLYRLGYRQYFPGPTWEIVPRQRDLSVTINTVERPSYHARRIWYGYGPWDHAREPYLDWCRKNRATGGIDLDTGHIGELIRAKYAKVFDSHPEYLGLVQGQRTSDKFCISHPALRQLIVEHALQHFHQQPQADSLSVEPSDGLGWCECAECAKLGSPSDRAVLLANQVATAVESRFPGKRFGMYAYGGHVAPPNIDVHPRLVISAATAFGSAGLTLDELLSGWRRRGATLGIREYFGVHPWDRDLPGAARGANLDYLSKTIPHFHEQGARYFSAESSDNWGPNGLGYFLAARMLWDIDEAQPERLAELRQDFLRKSFGPVEETMDRFYRLIDGARRPLLSDDLIGRMYRLLDEARTQLPSDGNDAEIAAIRARLDALTLYAHYVERFFRYRNAAGPARQQEFERLIRFAYRMRGTMMIHTLGLYRDLVTRDQHVQIPAAAAWDVPEGQNPWKDSTPFTTAEIDALRAAGIAAHPLLDFESVSFSDQLVPAAPLRLQPVKSGDYGLYFRHEFDWHTWANKPETAFSFSAKAGLIYGRLGDAKWSLFPHDEPQGKAVAAQAIPPDKQQRDVRLTSTIPGLQRLHLSDGGDGTELTWPDGTPLTMRSDPEQPAELHGRWTLYFYVPRGTSVIGGFADGPGELRDPAGMTVKKFGDAPGFFSVPVPPGQDRALWQFHHGNGRRLLMTVPPYLARNERELLLPKEVVERDVKE